MFFFQVVQLLLSSANANEPIDDAVGLTPLHLAVISNQIEVAKVFSLILSFLFIPTHFKLIASMFKKTSEKQAKKIVVEHFLNSW